MQVTDDAARVADVPGLVNFRTRLFFAGLALAALFHLAGNPRATWIQVTPGFLAVQLAVAAAAVSVLVAQRSRLARLALCALIPISAWMEAPIVGNHWVLAACLSLCYLLAEIPGTGARSSSLGPAARQWARFAPAARLSLLVAYAFAAFAKFNRDFFDPEVSCAVFYQDQLVRSWGLDALTAVGRPGLGVAVAVAAAVTELSVAVLLAGRRTRRIGLLIALPFHWLLALDFDQHFWDFSAVLFVGFLLFADDAVIRQIRDRIAALGAAIGRPVRRVAVGIGAVAVMFATAVTVRPDALILRALAGLGGHIVWVILGTAVLLVVISSLRAAAEPRARMLHVQPVMLIIPVLVFVNGLTPYFEVKTGFGWNMYSNLRTVAGETNHLLVPRTVDLTNLQEDRVTIVEASDSAVQSLATEQYEVVYSEFREYAHAYPEQSVAYQRRGRTVDGAAVGDSEAGQGGVSLVSYKLQSFRPVDASGRERCQAVFSPAR